MKKVIIIVLIGIAGWIVWKQLSQTPKTDEFSKGAGAGKTISAGEKVDLRNYLEPAQYTVFFFYADW